MSDEEDPEVIADMWLRENSQRDRTRTRISEAAIGNATVSAVVAHWSCRRPSCRKPCGVTEEAIHAFEVHNRALRNRGEEPLNTTEIMICDDCQVLIREKVATRNAEQRVEMAGLIRQLKDSAKPREEHDVLRRLEKLRHPDLSGLLEWCAARLEKTGKRAGEKRL